MDANSLTVQIKTDDIYEEIAGSVKTRFDTPNYELDRPLTEGKNKKVLGLIKDKLDEKIVTKLLG